jgi:uncharacterized protein YdhG (YjbR/CyaY superfamily)
MKKATDMPLPRTIDEYLFTLSEKQQEVLCTLWEIIKTIAPDVEEAISYQIPVFKQNGMLVGFGAAKKHLSFYVMSMTLLEQYKEELQGYDYSGSTIRFSVDNPLPNELVEKIVRKRVEMNAGKKL